MLLGHTRYDVGNDRPRSSFYIIDMTYHLRDLVGNLDTVVGACQAVVGASDVGDLDVVLDDPEAEVGLNRGCPGRVDWS